AGVNVEFEALAQAWGHGDEVMISTTLDGDFKSTLSRHAAEIASDGWEFDVYRRASAATVHYFDLWVYDGEISGQLTAQRDREFCGMAVWPETYCDVHRIAFPQDKRIEGFDAEMALGAVRGLGDQMLLWPDGTTTHVQFDVQPAGGSLCVGPYFPHGPNLQPRDAIEVQLPVTIRVKTSDGLVDTELPGALMPVISHSTGLQDVFKIESGFIGPRAAVEAAGVELMRGSTADALSVSFTLTREATETIGMFRVSELDPAMPQRELEPNWQQQPLTCSSASVGLGTSVQGIFEVMP
ncbi:MAG TPA: hypothetical protein VJR89_14055, partial [Polyangiales bacterium]|nr:hypothetical protein [Polyangiales bacterium]